MGMLLMLILPIGKYSNYVVHKKLGVYDEIFGKSVYPVPVKDFQIQGRALWVPDAGPSAEKPRKRNDRRTWLLPFQD